MWQGVCDVPVHFPTLPFAFPVTFTHIKSPLVMYCMHTDESPWIGVRTFGSFLTTLVHLELG